MNPAGLYAALKETNLPVAYGSFEQATQPPYVVYMFHQSGGLKADNRTVLPLDKYKIELYTKAKDFAAEELLENKLNEKQMPYEKYETGKIASVGLWQVVYIVQTIGK